MNYERDIKLKSDEELINRMDQSLSQKPTDKDQIQIALTMRFTQQITQSISHLSDNMDRLNTSIKKYSDSSDKLTKRIFYLNIILTIATAVGATATLIMAFN